MLKRGALLLGLFVLSCGAPPKDTATPVVIPDQAPSAAFTSAPPSAVVPPPPGDAPVAAEAHVLTPGSNGPKDAVGMVGDAGKIVAPDPVTVLLVSSMTIRTHPMGARAMQLLTSVLAGWGQFMPMDLIDPAKDVDWVLLTGSLVMGSTQQNVFLARYNVSEKRADLVSAELMKRLKNGRKTQLGVPGASSFTAMVDGADRVYVRPKPNVLAIVPAADGKRAAELLKSAEVKAVLRPGELARVSWRDAQRLPLPVPNGVTALRVWINGTANSELVIAAEGDCSDAMVAAEAVDDLRSELRANTPGFARTLFRPFIDDAAIWADGSTLRYEAKLPEGLLEMLAGIVCMRATGRADCSP
jgi:hypothetical protein